MLVELGLGKEDLAISQNTIKDQILCNIEKTTRGPTPLAADIESILVVFATYHQQAHQPLDKPKTISIANSLLEGSRLEDAVRAFHTKNKVNLISY